MFSTSVIKLIGLICITNLNLVILGRPVNNPETKTDNITASDLSTTPPFPLEEEEEVNGTDTITIKRTVGRAMNWLRSREDSIHTPNSTLAGDNWHGIVPWGKRRREDTVAILPSIPNFLPKIPHIEDPEWAKKLFG